MGSGSRPVIFYLVRSKVYHLLGTEASWDASHTLCGWNYRGVKERVSLYYEAKLGTDWTGDGACAYGRRLCKRCAMVRARRG